MAGLAEKLGEEVTCSICLLYFKEPIALACLHRFCRTCIQRHINSKPGDQNIICPKCLQPTRPPHFSHMRSGERIKRREWALHLPTDFLISTIVENLEKEEAEGNEKCKKHKNKPLVLFCQDCDVIMCHVCAGVDHRRCDGVVSLGEEAEKERERLREESLKLEEKRDILNKREKTLYTWRNHLTTIFDQHVLKVTSIYTKINTAMKTEKEKCLKELGLALNHEKGRLDILDLDRDISERNLVLQDETLRKALNDYSDYEVVKRKMTPGFPAIKELKFPGGKRPLESYEELFDGILNKSKVAEFEEYLERDI